MLSIVKKVIIGLVIFVGLGIALGSWYTVAPTERAVIVRLGHLQEDVRTEGLHFKIPFLDSVHFADMRINSANGLAKSASKDLQNVSTNIAVNYVINEGKLLDLYRALSLDHEKIQATVFSSAIQESVKRATAQYTAEELVTKREKVREEIETSLRDKVEKFGVTISQVNIVNFDFSESFDGAIEAKVKAEQDALTSKNKLEQVKYEAQQQIERAKAEAETIRIQANAIQAQGGAAYVKLRGIEKWDGALPSTALGGRTPMITLK